MPFEPPRKYRIRVGAEPDPETPPLPDAPKEEETTPTDPKEFWNKFAGVAGPPLANGMAIGTAVALMQLGLIDKKALGALKPQGLISGFQQVAKLVLQERQTYVNELRKIWRRGPKQYLYRAGAALRK